MRRKLIALPLLLVIGACSEPAAGPGEPQQTPPEKAETAAAGPSQADAQKLYEEGSAKFKDGQYEASFQLWVQAAEGGSVDAAVAVARSWNYGQGTACDYAKAAEWYRRAADMGSAEAMYQLGEIYLQGKGVEANDATALEWMKAAAELKHPEALYMLGVMYTIGRGTEVRRDEGMDLIRQAADLGQENAMKTVELYEMLPQLLEKQKERQEQAGGS
jgi:hypothetical protein